MRIVITGSSGLIGSALSDVLDADGHDVVRLVRREPRTPDEIRWDPPTGSLDRGQLGRVDAAVNLAGAGIGDRRWSTAYKRELLDSRLDVTSTLATTLAGLDPPPQVLLSGSAVGIYGFPEHAVDERADRGVGFLPELCRDWEAATAVAEHAGIRVCHLRAGVVLSRRGGALGRLLPLFWLGLGGKLGSGKQYWSWVALADVIRAVRFLIASEDLRGPVNVTAPHPVSNAELTRSISTAVHRPALATVPRCALRTVLGEYADQVLNSQRVLPRKLLDAGFRFLYPTADEAVRAAVRGY